MVVPTRCDLAYYWVWAIAHEKSAFLARLLDNSHSAFGPKSDCGANLSKVWIGTFALSMKNARATDAYLIDLRLFFRCAKPTINMLVGRFVVYNQIALKNIF